MRTNAKKIADAIHRFLVENDWNFSYDEEHGIFKFLWVNEGVLKIIRFYMITDDDSYTVYAVSPIGIETMDDKKMTEIAKFACLVNSGLANCNIEPNMKNGEISVKYYVDCADNTPTQKTISNSIHAPAATFYVYGDGIVDILLDDGNAMDSINKCEFYPSHDIDTHLN